MCVAAFTVIAVCALTVKKTVGVDFTPLDGNKLRCCWRRVPAGAGYLVPAHLGIGAGGKTMSLSTGTGTGTGTGTVQGQCSAGAVQCSAVQDGADVPLGPGSTTHYTQHHTGHV